VAAALSHAQKLSAAFGRPQTSGVGWQTSHPQTCLSGQREILWTSFTKHCALFISEIFENYLTHDHSLVILQAFPEIMTRTNVQNDLRKQKRLGEPSSTLNTLLRPFPMWGIYSWWQCLLLYW
jgi:hypothetical protein